VDYARFAPQRAASKGSTNMPPLPTAHQQEQIQRTVQAQSPLPFDEVQKRMPARVDCMAYRVGARYRAICLDFSLIAESSVSIRDAQERLADQLADYVADVVAEGCPPHLVNRAHNWIDARQLRILIGWAGVKSSLAAMFGPSHSIDKACYTEPLPVPGIVPAF
jgi:hypothetical protein